MNMRETLASKRPLAIIAVIVLVILAGLLIYGILVTPARQPYRDALTQYKNVDTALGNTNISLNSSSASDDDFNKSITAIKSAFTSLGKENDALAKEAVLTSGEGKTLYQDYNTKLQNYITYNTNVITSIQKVRPVLHKCSNAMNNVSENATGAAVMHGCAADMRAIESVPDADYKQLVQDFSSDYAKLATVLGQIAALPDPKGADAAQYSALTKERDTILSTFSADSSTFSTNVQNHRKAILTTDAAKALSDWLTEKSRVF